MNPVFLSLSDFKEQDRENGSASCKILAFPDAETQCGRQFAKGLLNLEIRGGPANPCFANSGPNQLKR